MRSKDSACSVWALREYMQKVRFIFQVALDDAGKYLWEHPLKFLQAKSLDNILLDNHLLFSPLYMGFEVHCRKHSQFIHLWRSCNNWGRTVSIRMASVWTAMDGHGEYEIPLSQTDTFRREKYCQFLSLNC